MLRSFGFIPARTAPEGIRTSKGALVGALLILLAGLQAACALHPARHPDEGADPSAALERYRAEFGNLRPGRIPLSDTDPNYLVFSEVMHHVLSKYVMPTDPQILVDKAVRSLLEKKRQAPDSTDRALTESAIKGMLASLDTHSAFLEAEELDGMRTRMRGEFTGLGLEIALDQTTGFVRVLTPMKDSPAAQAGVQAGDLITMIGNKTVNGLSLRDTIMQMRGPAGTPITLMLQQPNRDTPVQVSLKRAAVKIESVLYRLEGRVAYLRIIDFNETTAPALDEAIRIMRRQADGELSGAVLDLRGNPGGLVEQAVKVVDRFLGAVDVVSIRNRVSDEQHYSGSGQGEMLLGLPLVVLIDGASASASEIVAGALQDYGRALLFGTRSFGKGSVQAIIPLSSGDGILLTIARYFRPSGGAVDCFGVSPNLELPPPLPQPGTAAAPAPPEKRSAEATCTPGDVPPPPPKTWTLAELCPEIAGIASKSREDRVLQCAVAAIRAHRAEKVPMEWVMRVNGR